MIQDASSYVFNAPWLMVPTGVVLALTVVAANELADAIAGKVDRRRRSGRGAGARVGARRHRVGAPADPAAVLEVRDLAVSVDDGPAAGHRRLVLPASPAGCSAWSGSPAAARR